MKTVRVKCVNCGTEFDKLKKEHDRCLRNGYAICCSRSCACTYGNLTNPREGNVNRLNPANRQDNFSAFRYYVNKAKSTERKQTYGEPNITVEYLKSLWESQKGICPYTGYAMELPHNTQMHHIKASPRKASLDRIDTSKGYIEGNVEFVCLAVNLAKNKFSRSEMLDFFKH